MNSLKLILLFALIGLSYAQYRRKSLEDRLKELFPNDDLIPMPSIKIRPIPRRGAGRPSRPSPDLKLDESDCTCRIRASSRIVKGEVADPNSIPWQVSLASVYGDHFCGGAIVNKNYILTAVSFQNQQLFNLFLS